MLIDRPTPATRNGLGNVIHGWPRWMLCQAFKKHKLCSSWRVKKSLFSGNCQVGCCLLRVLQLGHHTPHKISVSSGFKAFLCSTLTFFIVAMVSHLQLFSIEDFGKSPYWVHTLFCDATPVPWRTGRTKVALVELPTVNLFGFFFCTPFPLRILAWSFIVPQSNFHPPKAFHLSRISTLQKLFIL